MADRYGNEISGIVPSFENYADSVAAAIGDSAASSILRQNLPNVPTIPSRQPWSLAAEIFGMSDAERIRMFGTADVYTCLYTATSQYRDKGAVAYSNKALKENPEKYGFTNIPVGEARRGDLFQFNVDGVPEHSAIFTGEDEEHAPLVSYSRGGVGATTITPNGEKPTMAHNINIGVPTSEIGTPSAYRYIGSPEKRKQWAKDYYDKYYSNPQKPFFSFRDTEYRFPIEQKAEGGNLYQPRDAWEALSLPEKAEMIKVAVRNGITDLKTIREKYNEYAEGGKADIHIKPENRGKFTALKERTGHSATWFKEHGTPAQRKMATFALNARHWKHGEGGNLFDGISNDTGQMQIGVPFWQKQSNQPSFFSGFPVNGGTLQEVVVIGNKSKKEEARKQRLAEMQAVLDKYQNDYQTAPNDNAWVETPLTYKRKNPHLTRRSLEGAKAHAAWEKEHPNLTAWGNVLGAAPFAVAAYPFAAAAGSGVAALGDAAAATTAGQGITNFLAPVATSTIAGAPALEWANVGLQSMMAGHGVSEAVNGTFTPMTALELTPMLQVAKPVAEGAVTAAKTAYDNGTLWDAYTTFGGRFGNYGDNILTNIYGTAARRFGLPDKARVPADAIRKIKGDVHVDNGIVDLTGNKPYLGNPHVNATLDRGVVSHSKGAWDGANTYITPTENFLEQTQGSLKSIEPSDMFSNGARVTEVPQNVTLISGDVESLNRARKAGMQTLSSPKLRRLYQQEKAKYLAEKAAFDEQYAKASGIQRLMLKAPASPKSKKWWPEYAAEVQRLQAQRGTPTLADFRLLEEQTGLNSGVAPISEYQNAIRQLEIMQNADIPDIMAGKVQQYIYPNGRVVDWSKVNEELDLVKRAKYNKVFYDPASYVESDWQVANGVR